MIQTVLSSERVPVKIWTAEVEEEAKQQLLNTAKLPFVFKHVAVMPDVHAGKGATVGTVIATKGAICPAAVGVDIGCGMMAAKLVLSQDEKSKLLDTLVELRRSIERSVPVGFSYNHKLEPTVENWAGWGMPPSIIERRGAGYIKQVKGQLGSLGGGNHFIEVCKDETDELWIMLHSGSRNIGKTTADFHIDAAKGLMARYFINLDDPDLAFLAQGTPEFALYLKDLNWCQTYAFANREEMMRRILRCVSYAVGRAGEKVDIGSAVNCHHNYVEWENHFGENVLVTRKGAVRARTGDLGIIPGSMGTKSYIVRGLGNEDSFHSCSHGAGRRMSRTKARATFTKEDFAQQTEGVVCRKDLGVLDEIPGAYKDIDAVMANQKDLVEVVAILKQVLCVKG